MNTGAATGGVAGQAGQAPEASATAGPYVYVDGDNSITVEHITATVDVIESGDEHEPNTSAGTTGSTTTGPQNIHGNGGCYF